MNRKQLIYIFLGINVLCLLIVIFLPGILPSEKSAIVAVQFLCLAFNENLRKNQTIEDQESEIKKLNKGLGISTWTICAHGKPQPLNAKYVKTGEELLKKINHE